MTEEGRHILSNGFFCLKKCKDGAARGFSDTLLKKSEAPPLPSATPIGSSFGPCALTHTSSHSSLYHRVSIFAIRLSV